MSKRKRPEGWTKKSKRVKKESPPKPANAWIEFYNYRKGQEKNNPIYFNLKKKVFESYFQKRLKKSTDVEKSIPIEEFKAKLLECLKFQDKKFYAFDFKKFQSDISPEWQNHKEEEDDIWKRFIKIQDENFKEWRIKKKAHEVEKDKTPLTQILREVLEKLDEIEERVEKNEKEVKRLSNLGDNIC